MKGVCKRCYILSCSLSVVKAESYEEAIAMAEDVAKTFEHRRHYEAAPLGTLRPGGLVDFGRYPEGSLVLDPGMLERLDEFGYAHRFVPKRLKPYQERVGHKAFLP